MSWASARAAHGLDEGVRVLGPHERGYAVIWNGVTVCLGLMALTLAGALTLAVVRDGFGADAPDIVNTALTVVSVIWATGFLATLPAMFAVDRVDRRRAWRDDELQARLAPGHSLARPCTDPGHTTTSQNG